jgi:hypothetical protein
VESFGVSGYGEPGHSLVNVMFLSGDSARLLLDRAAYIRSMSYPERSDSLRGWIAYEVATMDTNGDGRLDERDGLNLAISDVEGRGFRMVLPPDIRLDAFHILDRNTVLVYAFGEAGPRRGRSDSRRQLVFRYNVSAGELLDVPWVVRYRINRH